VSQLIRIVGVRPGVKDVDEDVDDRRLLSSLDRRRRRRSLSIEVGGGLFGFSQVSTNSDLCLSTEIFGSGEI
jgi:hypothetical protein